MPVKTFTFKQDTFITGRTACSICGHKFRYALTFAQLLIWNHACAICSNALPLEYPDSGMILTEVLDVRDFQ